MTKFESKLSFYWLISIRFQYRCTENYLVTIVHPIPLLLLLKYWHNWWKIDCRYKQATKIIKEVTSKWWTINSVRVPHHWKGPRFSLTAIERFARLFHSFVFLLVFYDALVTQWILIKKSRKFHAGGRWIWLDYCVSFAKKNFTTVNLSSKSRQRGSSHRLPVVIILL